MSYDAMKGLFLKIHLQMLNIFVVLETGQLTWNMSHQPVKSHTISWSKNCTVWAHLEFSCRELGMTSGDESQVCVTKHAYLWLALLINIIYYVLGHSFVQRPDRVSVI